jgi:hypothetical protein
MLYGRTRIDKKFIPAGEAEMGRVIPDTQGEALVIRVVGILLAHRGIEVVGISVGPRLDGFTASSTFESATLCHGYLLLPESCNEFEPSDSAQIPSSLFFLPRPFRPFLTFRLFRFY